MTPDDESDEKPLGGSPTPPYPPPPPLPWGAAPPLPVPGVAPAPNAQTYGNVYPPPPPPVSPPPPYPAAYPQHFQNGYGIGPSGLKPHRGTLVLIFGLLGLACCGLLSIPAVVMGRKDLAEMDAGIMDPSGRSTTNAGRIVGIIALAWSALVVLGWVALISFSSIFAVSGY